MPRQPFAITPEQIAAAQALRAEGLTYLKIATQLDVPFSTVVYWTSPTARDKAKASFAERYAKNREKMLAYSAQYHLAKRKPQLRARKAKRNG